MAETFLISSRPESSLDPAVNIRFDAAKAAARLAMPAKINSTSIAGVVMVDIGVRR